MVGAYYSSRQPHWGSPVRNTCPGWALLGVPAPATIDEGLLFSPSSPLPHLLALCGTGEQRSSRLLFFLFFCLIPSPQPFLREPVPPKKASLHLCLGGCWRKAASLWRGCRRGGSGDGWDSRRTDNCLNTYICQTDHACSLLPSSPLTLAVAL